MSQDEGDGDEYVYDRDKDYSTKQTKKEPIQVLKLVGIVVAAVAVLSTAVYMWMGSTASSSLSWKTKTLPLIHSPHLHAVNVDPFQLDPVQDLGMLQIDRSTTDASPSDIWNHRSGPLPTNSWYLVRDWDVWYKFVFVLARVLLCGHHHPCRSHAYLSITHTVQCLLRSFSFILSLKTELDFAQGFHTTR
jgi:hypothetical protein